MLQIAYGEASFENLRKKKRLFIDKTHFIHLMENVEKFFFIRPRRFGKSLWISVLMSYYDLNKKDKFDELFRGLYIQEHPTDYRNSYLVLKFDFSGLNTVNLELLRNDFNNRVKKAIVRFFDVYNKIFAEVKIDEELKNLSASQMLQIVQEKSLRCGLNTYIFIDEYDHFANKLASEGREIFVRDIIYKTGFVREFYEQLKIGSGEGAFERFYITGVSPIMLDELASGFNIMSDMTTHPNYNEMLGFTEKEVRRILEHISEDKFVVKSKEEVFQDLVSYYNGYKFSEDVITTLFNSDMVLYFIQYFNDLGDYPKDMLDQNVKMDYGKLRGLIVGTSGKEQLRQIIEELNLSQTLNFRLVRRFTFENRLNPSELKSLLFFFGLLTFTSVPNKFEIPNYVIRVLHWEYFQKFLEESGVEYDTNLLGNAISQMAENGEVEGLQELVEDFFHNKLSSWDFASLSEKHVKFFFLSHFTLSNLYNVISEREIGGRKRIDLLFEANPAYYNYVKYNFIVEFKYIRKTDSEAKAKEKRVQAIEQARENFEIYKRDFKQFGRGLRTLVLIVNHTKEVELIKISGFES